MANIAIWKVVFQALQILINVLNQKIHGHTTIAIVVDEEAIQTPDDQAALEKVIGLSHWHRRLEADPDKTAAELAGPLQEPENGLLSHTHTLPRPTTGPDLQEP